MGKRVPNLLQKQRSYDEPDRVPRDITISNFDIFLYYIAIVAYFIDLVVDINVAVRYYMLGMMPEFAWTVAFIVFPALVNTAVSYTMFYKDEQEIKRSGTELSMSGADFSGRKCLRYTFLVFLMAPVVTVIEALIYASKSRKAYREGDSTSQQRYYKLMLDADADAALLRVMECFLEAAPQQVLQTSLLYRRSRELAVHQLLSIASSIGSMGWCLAAYQRALRFPQRDKYNMSWLGSVLQTLWHFLVTLSRVISLSAIAYLYPEWTILACGIHILIMTGWLQIFDLSPFCSHNKIAEIAFSFTLGAVYLFTYILPVEGRTRYRYSVYYTICFVQNLACCTIWFLYSSKEIQDSVYYFPVFVLCTVPYCVGLVLMVVYYSFFHPRVRKGVADIKVNFKANDEVAEIS